MIPATVLLNYKDGVYAIDSRTTEWDDPDKNILTWLVCRTQWFNVVEFFWKFLGNPSWEFLNQATKGIQVAPSGKL